MDRDEVKINADKIIKGVAHRNCPKCGVLKPLDDFGLRRMAGYGKDGSDRVTNQSWCRPCRSK
jgi:hypothetical protein